MEKVIRLGYEELLQVGNDTVPAAWFFGRQGEREDFRCMSDSTYRCLRQGIKNQITNWYLSERGTINHLNFQGDTEHFQVGLYKDFIAADQTFLVPIIVTSSCPDKDFQYLLTATFPEELLDYIHKGKATVLFYSHAEGNIDYRWFPILDTFCKNNNLSRTEAYLSISDLNKDKYPRYKDRKFGIRTFNYFGESFWFLDYRSKRTTYEDNLSKISQYRKDNWNDLKEKTFLCLNRRRMSHRTFMAGYFASDPKLRQKTYLSLGTANVDGFTLDKPYTGKDAVEYLNSCEYRSDRSERCERVQNYYKDRYDQNVLIQLDREDLTMTINPTHLPENLYRTSFVNVITETYCDSRGYQFLTEKTNKTIYAMMPFILVSTQGTLQALRELGFQTFSNWWSEKYDLIEDHVERLEEICRVIDEISKYSKTELHEMTRDMQGVLWHNANLLINPRDLEETLGWLYNIQNNRLQYTSGNIKIV